MHTGGVGALALEHGQQFFLEIEAVDYLRSAQADLVQAVAVPHPLEEGRALAKLRQVVVERAQGLARMPAGGVVDGHVQLEVVGVEAQLAQLLSGDQQVQRRLLVAEVVADHFGR